MQLLGFTLHFFNAYTQSMLSRNNIFIQQTSVYRHVRHPVHLLIIIALWATSHMNGVSRFLNACSVLLLQVLSFNSVFLSFDPSLQRDAFCSPLSSRLTCWLIPSSRTRSSPRLWRYSLWVYMLWLTGSQSVDHSCSI